MRGRLLLLSTGAAMVLWAYAASASTLENTLLAAPRATTGDAAWGAEYGR